MSSAPLPTFLNSCEENQNHKIFRFFCVYLFIYLLIFLECDVIDNTIRKGTKRMLTSSKIYTSDAIVFFWFLFTNTYNHNL